MSAKQANIVMLNAENHLATSYNIYLLLPQALLASLAQFEISTGSQIP